MKKSWINSFLMPFKTLQYYHDYQVVGLESIPQNGPCIIACSHSLITYDIIMLISTIIETYDRYPQCLVDTFLVKSKLQKKIMEQLGAKEANPVNARNILEQNKLLILAPGGMKEFLRPSKKKYQILWDDRKGFIRLAIETQTPIVLAACPIADDTLQIYDNLLTRVAYDQFKFPLFFASGFRGTPMPRRVVLKHFLSEVIYPPADDGTRLEDLINKFHADVVTRMKSLMKEAEVSK